jgi:hypothetical protein
MMHLFHEINKKINGLVWSLVSTGIILMMLAVLIVWTDFMLRLVFGMFVLVVAYAFLYAGYKVWAVRKEIERHLRKAQK